MRFAAIILAGLTLVGCASRPDPVPETGAFGIKYLYVDGDYYINIEKAGATQPVVLIEASHANRKMWRKAEWDGYDAELFPGDEINFDALRALRGSALVPAGLQSPTASVIPPCDTTMDPTYAKLQQRIIRLAKSKKPSADLTMTTTCLLHEGLSASQYKGIHERPNPYLFPTRYETIVDLDRDGEAEQRNVRIRNVAKADIIVFLNKETRLDKKRRRNLIDALNRM